MTMFDVTTLGEIMLRLSVPAGVRLEMAARLDIQPGGAEANLVSLLARLGQACAWVGALPQNPLGRLAANALRMAGVDLDGVVWCAEGRMGTYFVEFATMPRPIQVVYDRADSCAAHLTPDQVDWVHLLDTRLLHLTGITPALSVSCREVVEQARLRARQAGVPVSFDVNYRQKLWSLEDAAHVLRPLIQDVDLLFCAHGDAQRLFACDADPAVAILQLAAQTKARTLVMSIGDAGALAWQAGRQSHVAAVPAPVVDRLGAGDALAAGVVHGWLEGDLAHGLRMGALLAGMALSQHGDMVVTTPEEVETLLAASGAALVR
jgi:2-dehydro-3-deoxygluconokinase